MHSHTNIIWFVCHWWCKLKLKIIESHNHTKNEWTQIKASQHISLPRSLSRPIAHHQSLIISSSVTATCHSDREQPLSLPSPLVFLIILSSPFSLLKALLLRSKNLELLTMETSIACYSRGILPPSVSSQRSSTLVSPPSYSTSSSFKVRYPLHLCLSSV